MSTKRRGTGNRLDPRSFYSKTLFPPAQVGVNLAAWSGGSLTITDIDENIENVTYSGSAPVGANQWQAQVRVIALVNDGDTESAANWSAWRSYMYLSLYYGQNP